MEVINLVDCFDSLWHFGHCRSNSDNSDIDEDHQDAAADKTGLIISDKQAGDKQDDRSSTNPDFAGALCMQESNLKALFELIDENKDGFVSLQEIQALLTKLGFCMRSTEDEIAAALQEYHHYYSVNNEQISSESVSLITNKDDVCEISSDGSIPFTCDYSEFVKLYESLMKRRSNTNIVEVEDDEDKLLASAFKVYDRNGDGYISASELASVLVSLGLLDVDGHGHIVDQQTSQRSLDFENSIDSYCQTLINRFDTNGDGLVDLDEFKAMLTCHLMISS